jgi:hypothetical protein
VSNISAPFFFFYCSALDLALFLQLDATGPLSVLSSLAPSFCAFSVSISWHSKRCLRYSYCVTQVRGLDRQV